MGARIAVGFVHLFSIHFPFHIGRSARTSPTHIPRVSLAAALAVATTDRKRRKPRQLDGTKKAALAGHADRHGGARRTLAGIGRSVTWRERRGRGTDRRYTEFVTDQSLILFSLLLVSRRVAYSSFRARTHVQTDVQTPPTDGPRIAVSVHVIVVGIHLSL